MASISKTKNNLKSQSNNNSSSSPSRKCSYIATLKRDFPEIVKEWHPVKNDIYLFQENSNISHRLIWWQCSNNPSHEWQTSPYNRTVTHRGNCPYCRYSLEKWFPMTIISRALTIRKELFSKNTIPSRDLAILLAIIDYELRSKGHFLPSSTVQQIAKYNNFPIKQNLILYYRRILQKQSPLPLQTHCYLQNFVTGIFSQETVEKLISKDLSPAQVLSTSSNIVVALQRFKYFPRNIELVGWGCILLSMNFYKPDSTTDKELLKSLCEHLPVKKVISTKYRIIDKLKRLFAVNELHLQILHTSKP